MIIRGGPQYLGPRQAERSALHCSQLFPSQSAIKQIFYFKNLCWEVTSESIKELHYSSVSHHIWADEMSATAANLLPLPLIDVRRDDAGTWSYHLSPAGEKCTFLRFLINTSNFTLEEEESHRRRATCGNRSTTPRSMRTPSISSPSSPPSAT